MNFIKIPGKYFEMQEAPVTQSEWSEVMDTKPFYFKDQPNNPAESVSWNDCQYFIKKMNEKKDGYIYRLPTKAEWEYCAKPCDKQNIMEITWCWENSEKQTHPIKEKIPNEYGLYDMLGNVWEWCEDLVGSFRVLRGGSWGNDARGLRPANRNFNDPGNRDSAVGVRLVRTSVTLGSFTILPLDERASAASEIEKLKALLKEGRNLFESKLSEEERWLKKVEEALK